VLDVADLFGIAIQLWVKTNLRHPNPSKCSTRYPLQAPPVTMAAEIYTNIMQQVVVSQGELRNHHA